MTERSDLVRAVQAAPDGRALAQAVAALDSHDRARTAALNAERELDLGADIVAGRFAPVTAHERHTAATDWLTDIAEPEDYRTAMIAQASAWYRSLSPAVRRDRDELTAQAAGMARTAASSYGTRAARAQAEFLQAVGYLHSAEGASGLPQIDQLIDPNNQPQQTPYPTEVFPTFGEEQDQFNGVETDNHQSGISSEQAPLIQQVMQQQNSGSGYGSGPEKPDEHSEGFDPSGGYAEVPLGVPGQIPAENVQPGAGADQMASSSPNPIEGQPQDAGAGKRRAVASVEGYSAPDPFGYRWATAAEVVHPFHERCASAHWPDEPCGDRSHTASVAVGYSMDLDTARRLEQCERAGAAEGLRSFRASRTLSDLARRHNQVTAGWSQSGQSLEDTAVLHGFMATVRPAMADLASEASRTCAACSGGDCKNCGGGGCNCQSCGKKTASGSPVGAYMKAKEREFGSRDAGRSPNFT